MGNSVVTFGGTPANGSIGSGDGYVYTTFAFEAGQAGNAIGGGDLQLEFSGNTPMLSGTRAVISPGQSVSVPSASTVTATPGETLPVLDSAGRYVLVRIERADANGVSLQY